MTCQDGASCCQGIVLERRRAFHASTLVLCVLLLSIYPPAVSSRSFRSPLIDLPWYAAKDSRLLLQQDAACPLQFSGADLEAVSYSCNAPGQPNCCDQVTVAVVLARATYANQTGAVYLPQGQSEACLSLLQQQMKVTAGASTVLATCNVTAATFVRPPSFSQRPDTVLCGNYSALVQFVSASTAIRNSCYPNYDANATLGVSCHTQCSFEPTLQGSLAPELFAGPTLSGVASFSGCPDSILLALIGAAPSNDAATRMASCLYDKEESATCVSTDWSEVNMPMIKQSCSPCISGSGVNATACPSRSANTAATQCCNSILAGATAAWALFAASHGGSLFGPAVEGVACYDEYATKLQQAGVPRTFILEFCGFARDTFSTTHSGCNGLLTNTDYAAATNSFAQFNRSCGPDTCVSAQCFSNVLATATGLATAPGAQVSNLIGCAETIFVSYASLELPNRTALERSVSCLVGPFKDTILASEVAPVPISNSSSSSSPKAAIIGATIGGAAAITAIALLVLFLVHKRQQRRHTHLHRELLNGETSQDLAGMTQYIFVHPHSSEARPDKGLGPFLVQGSGSRDPSGSLESSDPLERLARLLLSAPRDPQAAIRPSPLSRSNSGQAVEVREPAVFTYKQLQDATEDFAAGHLVGEGGFGRVYSALLNGQPVAVKRLEGAQSEYGEKQFRMEVDMMNRLEHPHLLPLIGYCTHAGHRLLVYPYMPNGSLQQALHGGIGHAARTVDWPTRVSIALGAARALTYLHDEVQPQVIHRDFKSSNVLLDEAMQAKVSDFGLAKPMSKGTDTKVSTKLFGTAGYMPPEYMHGVVTEKNDVYAFGVVLMELISSRLPLHMEPSGEEPIVAWAAPFFNGEKGLDLMLDPFLVGTCPLPSLVMAAELAAACTASSPSRRPSMATVCHALFVIQQQVPPGSSRAPTRSIPITGSTSSGAEHGLALTDDASSQGWTFEVEAVTAEIFTATGAGSGPLDTARASLAAAKMSTDPTAWSGKTISMTALVSLLERKRTEQSLCPGRKSPTPGPVSVASTSAVTR